MKDFAQGDVVAKITGMFSILKQQFKLFILNCNGKHHNGNRKRVRKPHDHELPNRDKDNAEHERERNRKWGLMLAELKEIMYEAGKEVEKSA